MSRQVQLRRGTTAQNAAFTGLQGELIVDTDLNKVILHDGVTAGGHSMTGNITITGNTIVASHTNEDLWINRNGTGLVQFNGGVRVNGITVGHGTGSLQTSTVVGEQALNQNTAGFENSAFGNAAMYSNTIGTDNSAFGHDAMFFNTSGNFNVALGAHALLLNTTGNVNIAIGAYADTLTPTDNNSIVIGNYGTGIGSNSTVIGTPLTATTRLYGNLQVGTTEVISSAGSWVGSHIVTSAPAASVGQAGDVLGMVAVDATYLYYCTAAYDGVTSIWYRQALTGATWL